ncbi:MAG TPA: hypothetical protein VHU40_22755 [Polyangia bacterium]|jgi:hypothetical protein|nr:hypothetical protein [Polyangia bacterium]
MTSLRFVFASCLLVSLGAGTAVAEPAEATPAPDAEAGKMPAAQEAAATSAPSGGSGAADTGVGSETTAVGGVPMVDARAQDAAGVRYGLALRARWISVPSWMLGIFLDQSKSLSSYTTGIEGFRRSGDFDFVLGVSWQALSPPDGNWLGKNKNPALDTDYLQFKSFGAISVDAAFILRTEMNPYFSFRYGGGIGIGITTGKMLQTSAGTPGCASSPGDPTKCYPVLTPPCAAGPCTESELKNSEGNTDTPQMGSRFKSTDIPAVYPIINLVTGLDCKIPNVDGLEIKVDVGFFFPYFFAGGGVSYRI